MYNFYQRRGRSERSNTGSGRQIPLISSQSSHLSAQVTAYLLWCPELPVRFQAAG